MADLSHSFDPSLVASNSDAASDAESKAVVAGSDASDAASAAAKALSIIAAQSSAWEKFGGLTDAQVLAALSGDAGATFDWNAQDLNNIGNLDVGGITRLRSLVELAYAEPIIWNAYYDGGYKYRASFGGGYIAADASGNISFRTLSAGSADNPATFVERMKLHEDGTVEIFELDLGDKMPKTTSTMRAYINADLLNLTDSVWTTIVLNVENWDTGSDYNTGTGVFTAPVTGKYLVVAQAKFLSMNDTKNYYLAIYNNAGVHAQVHYKASVANDAFTINVSSILHVAQGDAVEMKYYANDAVETADIDSGSQRTFLAIHLLSEA